ncbi:YkvA family protein [Desulfococcus multivorans]|uniref:DUF1232 domain-containing protein n=1 Tax=Desulfococcus multivorans DSM 2059 TaxID=1121405 RepID=S7T839_DESML|nr:DUF1232 domain-containing protein [Desulfococcus multivorans]AOY59359.1 uncharacterized protein, DUF1232 [Desulfococcus multivorans]AQV01574.1 hypothetical protein B2D07_12950 [Desulfococcus multivorans]EPR33312.1 protein of unknown function DUF1232 [Desulfococcus multivorans DSM 2059]SKA13873.1 Protein of unknown function [Desulfococcus multivorans DSM 2059]
MNIDELLKTFSWGKTVSSSDRGSFFIKMANLVGGTDLEVLWHIVTHPSCAAEVFGFVEIAKITAAVAYVVMPLDAVPDVLPVLGLADDAAVIAYILSNLKDVMKLYRKSCM